MNRVARGMRIIMLVCLLCAGDCIAQSAFSINVEAVRRSVVFLHKVDASGNLQEAGTGFLLVVPTKSDPNRGYWFLVTARHIADPTWNGCPATGTLNAVFNKKDFDPKKDIEGTIRVPVPGGWVSPDDDSADVAVAVLNAPLIASLNIENAPLSIGDLPSSEELKRINTGAQIASAGLLLGASGTHRNYPIFKFGYVSSVPDEKVPVACCAGCAAKLETVWMIAASLVPGNSGSPIFFVPVGFPGIGVSGQRAFLIGVQSSSFNGMDVAGMAPVSFVVDAIKKMQLPDINLGIPEAATPSSAKPTSAVPGPTTIPK
jgi:hypothetical protein